MCVCVVCVYEHYITAHARVLVHAPLLPSPPLPSPEMGYAQGMNDLLARFLVVTDSEVDSYWMFVRYMERKMPDFLEQSMMKKVGEQRVWS